MVNLVFCIYQDLECPVYYTSSIDIDLDSFLDKYVKSTYIKKYKKLISEGDVVPDYSAEAMSDFTNSYKDNGFDITHFNKKAKNEGIVPINASICNIETIHLSNEKIDFRKEFECDIFNLAN